jgi:homocysteine S-methyltransferase
MQQASAPEVARAEGILIAQEMLETARPMVQGVQVSAPFGRYTVAAEVLASVLSDGATPNQQDTIEGTSVGKL